MTTGEIEEKPLPEATVAPSAEPASPLLLSPDPAPATLPEISLEPATAPAFEIALESPPVTPPSEIALEPPPPEITPAPPHEIAAVETCANCKSPLSGHYCAQCGQHHEPHMHSMREFASEAFESVTHADSRVWRTLWLLISKPGFLTREFIEGRRVRYLPPFRLYLVLSVVMFLVASAVSHYGANDVEASTPDAPTRVTPGADNAVSAETLEQRAHRICDVNSDGPESWVRAVKEGCRKVAFDNGRGFAQAMVHNIPRALFLLLPLLALVMRAMYWRRYYVEHLLFFIHTHAFTFVLFTAFMLAWAATSRAWLLALYILVLLFYPPYYTYKAMRRVYAQGRWVTRLKFFVLALADITFILVLAVFTSIFSLVTL